MQKISAGEFYTVLRRYGLDTLRGPLVDDGGRNGIYSGDDGQWVNRRAEFRRRISCGSGWFAEINADINK